MSRSQWVKKVPGGWSALTKQLLRGMFIRDKISLPGVQLSVNGGTSCQISFWALLADEEALAAMWPMMGASSISPCGIVCSVTNKPLSSDVARGIASISSLDPAIPDISCAVESQLGMRSDRDVWGYCDELEAAPAGERAELQKLCGIKYQADGLLYDTALRPFVSPTSSNRFDAMHILASNGLLNVEIALFLSVSQATIGASFAELRSFLAEEGWSPKTDLFSVVRETSCTGSIKAGASEIVSTYPVMRRFVLEVYGDDAQEPHVRSFLLLCEIVDICMALMHGAGTDAAAPLPSLVSRYLPMFTSAHGVMALKWKHHALVHLYRQIITDGMLLTCWVTERKNIDAKAAFQLYACGDHRHDFSFNSCGGDRSYLQLLTIHSCAHTKGSYDEQQEQAADRRDSAIPDAQLADPQAANTRLGFSPRGTHSALAGACS